MERCVKTFTFGRTQETYEIFCRLGCDLPKQSQNYPSSFLSINFHIKKDTMRNLRKCTTISIRASPVERNLEEDDTRAIKVSSTDNNDFITRQPEPHDVRNRIHLGWNGFLQWNIFRNCYRKKKSEEKEDDMMMVMADRTVCRHHRDNRCTLSLFAHIQSLSNESRVCDSPV